jgi:hypothetical protein
MPTWEYMVKHVSKESCLSSVPTSVEHLADCCRTADGNLTFSG